MSTPIDRAAPALFEALMGGDDIVPVEVRMAMLDRDDRDTFRTAARAVFESIDPDDLARVLSENWRNMHTNESLGQQRMLANAAIAHLTGKDQT